MSLDLIKIKKKPIVLLFKTLSTRPTSIPKSRGGGAPKIPYMRPQARRQDVSNWRFAWAVHGIEAHVQHKRHSAAGAV